MCVSAFISISGSPIAFLVNYGFLFSFHIAIAGVPFQLNPKFHTVQQLHRVSIISGLKKYV
jgi:hypothetical protein